MKRLLLTALLLLAAPAVSLAAQAGVVPVQVFDSSGNAVDSFGGGEGGGTSAADDADFTAGTTAGTPAMGVYESSPTACTDGDACIVGITENREVKTSGAVTSVVPGTGATNLGKEVGAADGATDTGVAALAVRDDATTTLSESDDGEYTPLRVNARGALWVGLETALSHTIDTVGIGDGTNTALVDPCAGVAKTTTPVSVTTDTVIISATSAKKNYICAISIVAAAAEIVSITEGTGSVCATNEAALVGSTTDANGMSLAANGGFVMGNGSSAVINGITSNVDTCLNVSGTNRVSGFVTWVQR